MDVKIKQTTRILVITPHPDDECIALGGFLKQHNAYCDVLLATNGALGNPEWDCDKTIKVRRLEFINAMKYIGIKKIYMLSIMDQELKKNLFRLNEYLRKNYDYIFLPYKKDNHPDHRCIYRHVRDYIKLRRIKSILIGYEVWTPIEKPNFFYDISGVYKEKENAIKKYECQLRHVPYDLGSLGLNRYRGMLCGAQYAEEFYVHYPIRERIKERINNACNK